MVQDTHKKCAVCGELVPQHILECPKCGRSVFETQKNASAPIKHPAEAAQTKPTNNQVNLLVSVWRKLITIFAKLFGHPTMPLQTEVAELQTRILVYVFCNGFHPDGMLLNTLSLAWLTQEYGSDEQMLVKMSAVLGKAAKYGFSMPQVPSDAWAGIANQITKVKVEQMHPNRETRFIIFSKKIDPKMPDAMIAVVFGTDETDIVQAERLMAGKIL